MKELIWVRVQYAARHQCCKTHKRPLPLPSLMKLQLSRQFFEKSSNTKFHENLSSGRRAVPCGQTDMTTLIVTLRNIANLPKNVYRKSIPNLLNVFKLHTSIYDKHNEFQIRRLYYIYHPHKNLYCCTQQMGYPPLCTAVSQPLNGQ